MEFGIIPIRVCCGQRHLGPLCPDGLVMCCLCFNRVPLTDLNLIGGDGEEIREDVCRSCAEKEANA